MKCQHLLVTGGAGFIGSNFVRQVLANNEDVRITNLDALTYCATLTSLADVAKEHGPDGSGRYIFVEGDIRDGELITRLLEDDSNGRIDAILNFAAWSHVDRAILNPLEFVDTNVTGTAVLLDCARKAFEGRFDETRFLQVSTDEVYGALQADDPEFTETTLLEPNSPYSASKAGAEQLVRSYNRTFGLPVLTTRCSNNYGPYQFPEKLIPLIISRAMADKPLPVYGDGKNIRDWLHVEDHCQAIWRVLNDGRVGEIYNIGGNSEVYNIDMVKKILAILDKPESLITFVTDRLGHDLRYAVNISKIENELGWTPSVDLDTGLTDTVRWYTDNTEWWFPLLGESETTMKKLYTGNKG